MFAGIRSQRDCISDRRQHLLDGYGRVSTVGCAVGSMSVNQSVSVLFDLFIYNNFVRLTGVVYSKSPRPGCIGTLFSVLSTDRNKSKVTYR